MHDITTRLCSAMSDGWIHLGLWAPLEFTTETETEIQLNAEN